jgi:hypothetical protein
MRQATILPVHFYTTSQNRQKSSNLFTIFQPGFQSKSQIDSHEGAKKNWTLISQINADFLLPRKSTKTSAFSKLTAGQAKKN